MAAQVAICSAFSSGPSVELIARYALQASAVRAGSAEDHRLVVAVVGAVVVVAVGASGWVFMSRPAVSGPQALLPHEAEGVRMAVPSSVDAR